MKKQRIISKKLFCILPMFLLLAHINNAIGQDDGFDKLVESFSLFGTVDKKDYDEALNKAQRTRMSKWKVLKDKATTRSDNYLKDYGRSLNDFDPKLFRMNHELIGLLAKYTRNVLRIADPEVDEPIKDELRLVNDRIKAGLEKDFSYSFERALDHEELDILFKLFPNPYSDNRWKRLKTIGELTDEERMVLRGALSGMEDLKRTVDRREAPREEGRN
ncbi:MAG TPA: hypothetical protein PKA00_19940 [Saprospiraceae bacterium]|nr:hypothetical protein [Saprospiraceae bacterium]HMQ85192.1 hypothetical protein [Saprospiraceae bacterium]